MVIFGGLPFLLRCRFSKPFLIATLADKQFLPNFHASFCEAVCVAVAQLIAQRKCGQNARMARGKLVHAVQVGQFKLIGLHGD
ncbi:hypothetical protein ACH51_11810 [Ralstonia solanacearum]|nr:hypothetical protein ACH51_11810 [Ralstonia solanacearum]